MISNLVLLTGEDSFRIKERIKFFQQKFVEKFPDGEVDFFDTSAEFSALENAVLTPNLFGGKRLIFCQSFWNSEKFEKADKIKFFEHLEKNNDTVTLIVSEPKIDKRLKASKFLLANANVTQFETLSESELINWITKKAIENDAKISFVVAKKLLHRVGTDLWNLSQEVPKLSLASDGEITEKLVTELTIAHPQLQIWDFTEALSKKDTAKTLQQFYELLASGKTPHEIFPMILRETRIHAQIRDGIDRNLSSSEIARETKIHPFVVKKTYALTKKFSAKQIQKMYDELWQIDKKLKTGGIYSFQGDNSEFELLIEKFILETCRH